MAWIYLMIAGFCEVIWAYTMKQSDGFNKIFPSILTVIFMIASVILLSFSMRSLPLGTAYTIWTGIGVIGAFVVGIVLLGEHVSFLRILAAILIACGMLLMKWTSNH